MIIAMFSWRQSSYLFDILLRVDTDFITSQIMPAVMFLFFSFPMFTDRDVLFDYLYKYIYLYLRIFLRFLLATMEHVFRA